MGMWANSKAACVQLEKGVQNLPASVNWMVIHADKITGNITSGSLFRRAPNTLINGSRAAHSFEIKPYERNISEFVTLDLAGKIHTYVDGARAEMVLIKCY